MEKNLNSESAEEREEKCNCWSKTNAELEKRGYKLSDACSMFAVNDQKLSLEVRHGLPLQRADGEKLKRNDARMLEFSFCPFCGDEV